MAKVDTEIDKDFRVGDFDTAWACLADAPDCLSHYPKLQELVPLGDDRWRWELEPTGARGFSHQVIYGVVYTYDREAGSIRWEPLDGVGNARVNGSFKMTPAGPEDDACDIHLHIQCSMEIPVPTLLKSFVGPFVKREVEGQIERFVANLEKALNP